MEKTLLLWLMPLLFCIPATAQNREIDSLKQELSVAKEDTNKVWILKALGEDYWLFHPDTGVIYARQGLQLAQKLSFERGEVACMFHVCQDLIPLGNYAESLNWGYKCLSLSKKFNNKVLNTRIYYNLGLCYTELGEYKQSIGCFDEELRLAKLYLGGGTEMDTIAPFWAKVRVYERNNQPDSALFYFKKANKGNDTSGSRLYWLGAIYAKLQHDSMALDFYKRAIPGLIPENDKVETLDCYNGIARVYLRDGKTDSAIYYAKAATGLQGGKAYPLGLMNAYSLLANSYESKNKPDSALKYLKASITLKDSLFNQQKIWQVESLNFDEQLHQQELAAQQQQNESNLKLYAAITVVAVMLLVAFFLYRNNRHRQKAYALLQKQKQEIDIQKTKVEQTLTELKSTQSQLIQSEKMASLGELTAGIAHEIQNPLNFVNNFSEVSNELMDEMKAELANGNNAEAIAIANDVKQNLEKITHHGKRADAIVKGMLQHSRKSTGVKELTDINALADEYLRLSYHGLRAKDKSFNAEIKTDFDNTIGKINITPQDIGRVLLNLFNNAFYAVMEKGPPPAL